MVEIGRSAQKIEGSVERQRLDTERGSLEIWDVSPQAYATRIVGHMQEPVVDLFLQFSETRVRTRGGRLYVFHDWLDMTGYDSVCRVRLTNWTVRNLGAFEEVHVALRSKLVAMGVQVANIPLRGLVRTHSARTSLERAMRLLERRTSST